MLLLVVQVYGGLDYLSRVNYPYDAQLRELVTNRFDDAVYPVVVLGPVNAQPYLLPILSGYELALYQSASAGNASLV